ncbi:alpha-L-fucosidase [Bacteroidota bacterium]
MRYLYSCLILALILIACTKTTPPEPFGAVPSERQLAWHKLKYYAFIHFSPNTFTDKEWGYGDELPSDFNPTELDCRQWARVASEAGMEGIIITAKHHDGFCLWPSKYTEHSVKNSPWKNGKGDILKDLREACDEYGLKLGMYLSPWDRNHAAYGTPEYIKYYRNQLRELLSNYGEIFEVWFDGANGGDGYYGGAKETRRIDNTTYYDWENTRKIVRELQPMACMFSDGGPDIRWVGNERGYAAETNWSTVNKNSFYPGIGGVNRQLQSGHEDGNSWLPAEVNTSIRPGWFYHKSQDNQVKSLKQLIDNWYHSVGMNGNFLLNLPPDQRGLIHENDVKRLMELKSYLDQAFSVNYAEGGKASASNYRGNSKQFNASRTIDEDAETYWTTDDDIRKASIEIDFEKLITLNAILLQEYIKLGQRIEFFSIEAFIDGEYVEISKGTTIGNRRIVKFNNYSTQKLRINFDSKACPLISNIEVYKVPDI